MYQKLFILATIALSAVSAHPGSHTHVNAAVAPASSFKFSETFPAPDTIPIAKPEWLGLIKDIDITDAPVYKPAPGLGPTPEVAGKDPYCDWTFTGCFGKDDLHQCPKGEWALTYDDGPSEFSPKLYDYLDTVNVKVTFFMVGGQVVKFPEYTLRAYQSGHELAMHTWSHSYMTTLTNEQIVAELKWNELAIKEVTGVSPRYFRPPYGDIDNRVRDVAAALGFVPIIWNHDTNDWAYASNPAVYKESWIVGNVTDWANDADMAKFGGVSLEHDLYSKTVDAALLVLPILQKAYTLTPIGVCNNVQMYKDDDKTAADVTNVTVSNSVAPDTTSVAPITSDAPATSSVVAPSTTPPSTAIAAGLAASSSASSFNGGASALGLGVVAIVAIALL